MEESHRSGCMFYFDSLLVLQAHGDEQEIH